MATIYLPTPKWCRQDEKSLCYEWVHDIYIALLEDIVRNRFMKTLSKKVSVSNLKL